MIRTRRVYWSDIKASLIIRILSLDNKIYLNAILQITVLLRLVRKDAQNGYSGMENSPYVNNSVPDKERLPTRHNPHMTRYDVMLNTFGILRFSSVSVAWLSAY